MQTKIDIIAVANDNIGEDFEAGIDIVSKQEENFVDAETRVDEVRTVGSSCIANISLFTRSSFKLVGGVLSGCTVHLMRNSSSTRILCVILSTSIICGVITFILYVKMECFQLGMMPVFYWITHTCLTVSESHNKAKRFFHRNVTALFRHSAPELHYSTVLWIRPFFSLYVTVILTTCMQSIMEQKLQNQDFGLILAEILAFCVTIHGIFQGIFCLAAKSDLQLLQGHLPDQRQMSAIHNTLDIIKRSPDSSLRDVLEARESQIFSMKKQGMANMEVLHE